jgi:hypothetical protein
MGKLTMKLVFTAIAVAVIGVSFVATAGTASADGPRDRDDKCEYFRGENFRGECKDDNDDRHRGKDKDWDRDDKHHNVCYKCNDDYEKKKHDYYDNKDNVRVRIVYAIIFATPVPTGYVDFTPYSQGVARLVQHTAWVIGIDPNLVLFHLSQGTTLVAIANAYGIGEAALIEGLIIYNPDLRVFAGTLVHRGWLLTSNVYIPL